MTQPQDDFGVVCTKWIPVTWTPTANARKPEQAQNLDDKNTQRLRMMIERETREKPSTELTTLEALMIEVLNQLNPSGACYTTNMAAQHIEWFDNAPMDEVAVGDVGQVTISPDANLPYPVTFNAQIAHCDVQNNQRHVCVALLDRSERVIDLYEQLVFIYYRRGKAQGAPHQMSLS